MRQKEIDMMQCMMAEIHIMREELAEMREQLAKVTQQKTMVTMAEACQILAIGRSTMQDLLKRGAVDFAVKNGKKWMFPVQQLRNFQERYSG